MDAAAPLLDARGADRGGAQLCGDEGLEARVAGREEAPCVVEGEGGRRRNWGGREARRRGRAGPRRGGGGASRRGKGVGVGGGRERGVCPAPPPPVSFRRRLESPPPALWLPPFPEPQPSAALKGLVARIVPASVEALLVRERAAAAIASASIPGFPEREVPPSNEKVLELYFSFFFASREEGNFVSLLKSEKNIRARC